MKMAHFALLILCSLSIGKAYSQSDEDEFDHEFSALDAQLEAQFNQQDLALEKRFIQVRTAVENAYKGLTEKISVKWQDDVVLPNQSSWTTYDESFTSRAIFDFDSGVYRIETIVDGDLAKSLLMLKAFASKIATSNQAELHQLDVFEQQFQQELSQVGLTPVALFETNPNTQAHIDVTKILASNTTQIIDSFEVDQLIQSSDEASVVIDETPPTSNQQDEQLEQMGPAKVAPVIVENTADVVASITLLPQYSEISPADIENEQIAQIQQEPQSITDPVEIQLDKKSSDLDVSTDLKESTHTLDTAAITDRRNAASKGLKIELKASVTTLQLTIPFINNYQKNLLEDKLGEVKKLASKYQLDVSLILAVIETESSFNPMAISPIPAFGLMQLVPGTAGLDAYEFLYGKRQIMSPQYLFDQDNNLLLGTTYLHLLSNRYLRDIRDQQSKLFCMLASYNTGVGNLAKTFVAKKSLSLAVAKINTMDQEQTYQHLMAHLPASETKNYLRKVLSRKEHYARFD